MQKIYDGNGRITEDGQNYLDNCELGKKIRELVFQETSECEARTVGAVLVRYIQNLVADRVVEINGG